jgi:hypothetical protein
MRIRCVSEGVPASAYQRNLVRTQASVECGIRTPERDAVKLLLDRGVKAGIITRDVRV